MVKTLSDRQAQKQKHQAPAQLQNRNPPVHLTAQLQKQNHVIPPVPPADEFVPLEKVPDCVSSPEGECLLHTTNVIAKRIARREETLLTTLRTPTKNKNKRKPPPPSANSTTSLDTPSPIWISDSESSSGTCKRARKHADTSLTRTPKSLRYTTPLQKPKLTHDTNANLAVASPAVVVISDTDDNESDDGINSSQSMPGHATVGVSFWTLNEMRCAQLMIRNMQKLVVYLIGTRAEETGDHSDVPAPYMPHHFRRLQARAECKHALSDLKSSLDIMFP